MTTKTDSPKRGLTIEALEVIRERLGLNASDMAKVLGVSRISYYNWQAGKGISKSSEAKIKEVLRSIATVSKLGLWPPKGAEKMVSKHKTKALLEILGEQE